MPDWFDPKGMFASGYPEGITSALRALPQMREVVRDTVAALAPRVALEVGPGDAPTLEPGAGRVFADVVPRFLAPLGPRALLASVLALPFDTRSFDVVLAADILTHIPPAERPGAIAELMRVAATIVLFNPEPGTDGEEDSAVPTAPLVAQLEGAGWRVDTRRFNAWLPGFARFARTGEYGMALITARRGSP